MINRVAFTTLLAVAGVTPVASQDAGGLDPAGAARMHANKSLYSPYAGRNYPTLPLFGDTHLHTSFSMDAGAFGATIGPREAYQFARGEEITASAGRRVKLSRPLDFLVVSDHSDNMGFFPDILAGKPELLADPTGRRWYDQIKSGNGAQTAIEIIAAFSKGEFPEALVYAPGSTAYRNAWTATIDAAEEFNDPGRFTALIGYEWTSMAANNNHRNVIFRDNGDKASQVFPFTVVPPHGSPRERDLYQWMSDYENKTGGRVLAIAHNGNVSNGRMFSPIQPFTDEPIDRAYVEARARYEPLYEVTQMKGDGEAHPTLSPDDEFADFETWDKGNLDVSEGKDPAMLQYEYARSGLKLGLKLESEFGVNPYKIGMIGSTDSHTGLSTAEEDNFFGKTSVHEPSAKRASEPFVKAPDGSRVVMSWEISASGYAAVWATENTRESIWDAMERRETYATTGPRMLVRFFGGWEFTQGDANNRMPANIGYSKGVPMGGDLSNAPQGKSPTFLVAALKDPIGANLDRIQVIKGWMDGSGELHERVYDVALSGDRKIDSSGRAKALVGNTVDVKAATWTNTIGTTELITVWEDPDFDETQRAFYYARVIEIPTPRWTAYDAKYFDIKMPKEVPMFLQERAYTSPIWYTPAN